MKIEQKKWTIHSYWQTISSNLEGKNVQLVLAFGDRFTLSNPERYNELKQFYPDAHIIQISTSGNILNGNIDDISIITAALAFEKDSTVEIQRVNIKDVENSISAGECLGTRLKKEGLRHVLLFSDGHIVNGSQLVHGLVKCLPATVFVTGGLVGDSIRFEKTIIGVDTPPKEGEIVVIGFYGPHLKFGFGSIGGWNPFGAGRKITRSKNNILYELDGKCALDLYKEYLGKWQKNFLVQPCSFHWLYAKMRILSVSSEPF